MVKFISMFVVHGLFWLQITDLLVNITKHCLKPKHYVLTPLEKQKLLSKYSVEDKQVSFQQLILLLANRV